MNTFIWLLIAFNLRRGPVKALAMILLALSLTSCASMETKWGRIEPGQTQDEVKDIMGNPDAIGKSTTGGVIYGWNVTNITQCRVKFGADSKSDGKQCVTDQAALARQQQMAMQYYQMQQNRPVQPAAYQPHVYQPRPTQTNCQTTMMNGVAQTNCSSAPSGIDASIYGN